MRRNQGERPGERLARLTDGYSRPLLRPPAAPGQGDHPSPAAGGTVSAAAVPGWIPADVRADGWTEDPGDDTGAEDAADGRGRPGRVVSRRAAVAAVAVAVAVLVGGGVRVLTAPDAIVEVGPAGTAPASRGRSAQTGGLPAESADGSAGGSGGSSATGPAGLPAGGSASGSPPGSAATGARAGVVVHVVGRVRRPGVRTLPAGARVSDAVTAAGGALPGAALDRVNLARVVADGEQVVVPGPGDPVPVTAGTGGAGPPAGTDGTRGAGRVVDLNAATEGDLDGLPGVGPVLAGRIVAWRAQHGRFSRVDELGEVTGIGPKLLERLRPLVSV